jgi:hypothetical protein
MRGPLAPDLRANTRTRLMNEATAVPYSLPAPYKGWNARGNLANMDPLEAILLDNIFPGVQDVSVRKGSANHSTGYPDDILTLMTYSSGTANKMFASTAANIYDATGSGAVGAAVAACTNGYWSWVNMANAAGQWLCMCNGVDAYKTYDGTTWATPGITGVGAGTGETLNYITLHQKRLWFVEENSMRLWYLGTDAISGAATQFPVGSLFKLGGKVVAIASWTVDNGSGSNDLFVILTSNGEIAVYQGTDPASSATWSLIGVYSVASPLGNRPFVKFGGDLLYLSQTGLIPMTKIIQSVILDRSETVSFKIDGAFITAVLDYGSNLTDWHMVAHDDQHMLLVNIPVSQSDPLVSYQFVMNTITKAWCRFTGWNANCWVIFNNQIYFGSDNKVRLAWVGTDDAGTPIVAQAAQAYSRLGRYGQKKISLVRPNVAFSSGVTLQMALDADFKTFSGQTTITYMPSSVGAFWDIDLWDTGVWDGGTQILDPKWTTVPADMGYLHSFRIQFTTSTAAVTWTSTEFAHQSGGIIG